MSWLPLFSEQLPIKAIKLQQYIPFAKVEEQGDGTLLVHCLVTAEQPDLTNEVCDYDTTKPYYKALAEQFLKATAGVTGMEPSMFPVREMHQLIAAGCGKTIEFDDTKKSISVSAHVVDQNSCSKVRNGVLIGFSHGGDYVKQWKDPVFKGATRYTAQVNEISLVDSPCLPIALLDTVKEKAFTYVKADGTSELRKFAVTAPTAEQRFDGMIERLTKTIEMTLDTKTLTAAAAAAPVVAVVDGDKDAMWRALIIKAIGAAEADRAELRKQIVIVARDNALDVKVEAKKFIDLHEFFASAPLVKSMYDVKDLADVLCTLGYVQSCLTYEREHEGDETTVPEDLLAVMENLRDVFLDLAAHETNELIVDAADRVKGEKAMRFESLEKAQQSFDALVQKNASVVKALHKVKAMINDHHDSSVNMHKAHHSDMHASKDHPAAKALATEHLGKALTHHADHMTKMHAHLDKTIESMSEGTAAPQGTMGVANQSIPGDGVSAHSKALTNEEIDQRIIDTATELVKALLEDDKDETINGGAAAGIGDRSQLDTTKKVHQGGVVVTKAQDNGQPAAAEMPTSDDVRKADAGDPAAVLKLARYATSQKRNAPDTVLSRTLRRTF